MVVTEVREDACVIEDILIWLHNSLSLVNFSFSSLSIVWRASIMESPLKGWARVSNQEAMNSGTKKRLRMFCLLCLLLLALMMESSSLLSSFFQV
jgi:hypothetical protein